MNNRLRSLTEDLISEKIRLATGGASDATATTAVTSSAIDRQDVAGCAERALSGEATLVTAKSNRSSARGTEHVEIDEAICMTSHEPRKYLRGLAELGSRRQPTATIPEFKFPP